MISGAPIPVTADATVAADLAMMLQGRELADMIRRGMDDSRQVVDKVRSRGRL